MALRSCTGCGVEVFDLTTDMPNGTMNNGPSSSGITVALAGDANSLFAVSCNAGVWRSTPSQDYPLGYPWIQLQNSPAKAYCIAVDPNNHSHIAVGERDGDRNTLSANHSGLWESFSDGVGNSWPLSLYFDPIASEGCTSQAVPAVAFSKSSTLFFATTCGIGVKHPGDNTPSFPNLPAGSTPITAIAVSETKVWARNKAGFIIFSPDDGTTWKQATTQPIPAGVLLYGGNGDLTTVAAFDNWVFMSTFGDIDPVTKNNFCQLLILDVNNDKWIVQKRINNTLNGTGIGARRQVKSYITGTDGQVGSGRELYFNAGQNVFRATGQNPDGTLNWENLLSTNAGDPNSLQYQNTTHSEIWDFLPTSDRTKIWVATDGGVFEGDGDYKKGLLMRSSGLHTQHVHDLYAPDSNLHMAYPTHDNDAWYRSTPGVFTSENILGDATWVGGDAGNSTAAILVRQVGVCGKCSLLTGFGNNLPSGTPFQQITLCNDRTYDSNKTALLKFIQTGTHEGQAPSPLDAFMIAKLPLQWADAGGGLHNCPGELANPNNDPAFQTVILRNPYFIRSPDINNSQGKDWTVVADNLPAGALGFWLSGGHANPTIYLLTLVNGVSRLWRATTIRRLPTYWQELNVQGNVTDKTPWPDSKIITGGLHGPVYPNPYNLEQVFVLTAAGVKVSTSGGFSFQTDASLTNFINGSGQFPMNGTFFGGNGANVDIANSYSSVILPTLSDMGWNRENPSEVVASSPYTGVFFSKDGVNWKSLSASLPTPVSPVSAVRITDAGIEVGTEGRGVLEIRNFR